MYKFCMALALTLATGVVQATQATKGKVTEVTVYRDQALVTRTMQAKQPKGPVEILVTDLPERVIGTSLSAESQEGCRIHSVTYRTKAIEGETRPEVQEIDGKIVKLENQLRELKAHEGLLEVKEKVIGKLEEFTAGTAEMEIQKGVLKFEELRQLTEYGLGKHDEFVKERLKLEEQRQEIEKQISLLKRKRSELTQGYSRMQREALIYLTKESDKTVTIDLSYLVSHVSWHPEYTLRSNEGRDTIGVEYNALVKQMSGEDWTNVRLTLSTAQPTFTSEPPVIEPLEIALGPQKIMKEEEVKEVFEKVRQRRRGAQKQVTTQAELSSVLNIEASKEQLLEMTQKKDVVVAARKRIKRVEGVSVTYQLPQRVSLASRTDEQILQAANVVVPAAFAHIGAPVLTDFVYQEASAKNTSPYVFLPGRYDSYLNGEFVGHGRIRLVVSGEEFKVGFGVDPQVQVVKEMVTKKESLEGGNKVTEFEYKLLVSNYGDKVVSLKLEDRLPYSPDESVQVKLLEATPEVSQDAEYQRTGFKKGLLRWEMEIPGQAINEKAIGVTYRFRMAHDKEMAIKGL